eukprot:maker-scaffold886_size84816-snap-gene-0.32 protein:Tk01974 transcript:maker-scaffold886_size84816-snap-gene-0.32-mRNA-1 annotation:"hypothetical protein L798_06361"
MDPRFSVPVIRPPSLPNTPNPPTSSDGLIRMLLQNAVPHPTSMNPLRHCPAPTLRPPPHITLANAPMALPMVPNLPTRPDEERGGPMLHPPPAQSLDREATLVQLDHSYAKPWNWKPETLPVVKASKSLFLPRPARSPFGTPLAVNADEEIDVLTESVPPRNPLNDKSHIVMEECHRFADLINPDVKDIEQAEDWEESVSKENWTTAQHRMFNRTMKMLHADRLARLALTSHPREPIQRRIVVEKTAKRIRLILAQALWEPKIIHWLHNTLCDNLPKEYLAIYLDVLQSLKKKIPHLVDKLLAGRTHSDHYSSCTREGMRLLMKRRWDPTAPEFMHSPKVKKLPNNPFVILTPSGPNYAWNSGSSRAQYWSKLLTGIGKLVTIALPPLKEYDQCDENKTEMSRFIQRVVSVTINRIRDIKRNGNQDRPIFLMGWGVAAAINCQIASMESVSGCVCLGFPLSTLAGMRGEVDDPCLLDIKSPVLFVVGQNASDCKPDDLEDVRERMRCETGMIIVGGADTQLRVTKHKKKSEGITQTMVDRSILDEVREFLLGLMIAPSMPPVLPMTIPVVVDGSNLPTGKKPASARSRKKNAANLDGMSPASKKAKISKTPKVTATPGLMPGPISGEEGPFHLIGSPSTPVRSVPGFERARKALEMTVPSGDVGQKPNLGELLNIQLQPQTLGVKPPNSAQIMASSPLLSSALTSPTKTSPVSGMKTPPTFSTPNMIMHSGISVTKGGTRPGMVRPLIPLGLPTTPLANASSISNTTLTSSPSPAVARPFPTPMAASRIASPPKASSVPNALIKTIGGGVSGTSKPGGPSFSEASSNMILLSQSPTSLSGAGSTMLTMSNSQMGKSEMSQTGPTLSIPNSVAQSIALRKAGVGSGSKESLYIVAVPPEQLKNLESGNLVQYQGPRGNQMVALLTADKAGMAKSGQTSLSFGSLAEVKSAASGEAPTADKRNVAEILASLSGLTPEPPKAPMTKVVKGINLPESTSVRSVTLTSSTIPYAAPATSTTSLGVTAVKSHPPRATASILASTGGRVVRVLTSTTRTHQQNPAIIRSPMATTSSVMSARATTPTPSSANVVGNRSRKQVFVTHADELGARSETDLPRVDYPSPIVPSDRTVVKQDGESDSLSRVGEIALGDRDVLEEDMDDNEYVPYKKAKKPAKVTRSSSSGKK